MVGQLGDQVIGLKRNFWPSAAICPVLTCEGVAIGPIKVLFRNTRHHKWTCRTSSDTYLTGQAENASVALLESQNGFHYPVQSDHGHCHRNEVLAPNYSPRRDNQIDGSRFAGDFAIQQNAVARVS